MNSRIHILFYIFFLNPDYIAARSLRSNNLLHTSFLENWFSLHPALSAGLNGQSTIAFF